MTTLSYRVFNKKNLAWCVVIIAIALFPTLYILDSIEAKRISLDFSNGHAVSQIPLTGLTWPGGMEGWSNVYVTLRLPAGISYIGHASLLTLDRKGRDVDDLSLNLDDGTVDHVFSQAMSLAQQLHLPTAPLEQWHDKAKRYGVRFEDFPLSLNNDSNPSISLEIHFSFDDWKPVFISLDFFWWPAATQASVK
jgi:hypothetical protein